MKLVQIKSIRLRPEAADCLTKTQFDRYTDWLSRLDPRRAFKVAVVPDIDSGVVLLRGQLVDAVTNWTGLKDQAHHFQFEVGYSAVEGGLAWIPGTVWCKWHNLGEGA